MSVDDSRKSVMWWTAVGLFCYGIVLVLHFQFHDAYVWLGTEDAFGENMTSVFYFLAGLMLIVAAVKSLRQGGGGVLKQTLPVLLGLFFIFVAGEEISWGQRILGFETPEAVMAENLQGETTLHNLKPFHIDSALLNQHTALNFIALMLGVVFPLMAALLGWFRQLVARLNFPVLQTSVMVWFVTGLAHGQVISKMNPHWANPEVKELIFSIGFFLFGLGYLQATKKKS